MFSNKNKCICSSGTVAISTGNLLAASKALTMDVGRDRDVESVINSRNGYIGCTHLVVYATHLLTLKEGHRTCI